MSERKKILLADDVGFFLTLEKSFLKSEAVEIFLAGNGREAFDLIRSQKPDLVLLDLYMPEMNGDQCCRAVKSDPELSSIPVIMVTTAGREDEQIRCREAGCDDILLKPIHRRVFVEAVRKYLRTDDRLEQRTPVRIQVLYGKEKLFIGYTVNLSSGGLFLETDRPLRPEESLVLRFHAPNQEQPINCRGSVAWVNDPGAPTCATLPPGMGIKFVDLELEQLYRIRALLQGLGQV